MSNYKIVNGELYHWGIKGMKWGHRKAKQTSGSSKRGRSNSEIEELRRQVKREKTKRRLGTAATIAGVGVTAIAAFPVVAIGHAVCSLFWENYGK